MRETPGRRAGESERKIRHGALNLLSCARIQKTNVQPCAALRVLPHTQCSFFVPAGPPHFKFKISNLKCSFPGALSLRRFFRHFPKIFRRRKHSRIRQLAPHTRANLFRPVRPGNFADSQMPPRRLIIRAPQVVHAKHRHAACPERPSRTGFSLSLFAPPANPPSRSAHASPAFWSPWPARPQRPFPRPRKIRNVLGQPRHAIRMPQIFSGRLQTQCRDLRVDHLARRLVHIMTNIKCKRR